MSCPGASYLRFRAFLPCALLISAFVLLSAAFAADTGPTPTPPPRNEETNLQETLRSYLQLQEQLHATQLAIERNRKEAEATAAESAKVFAARLQGIEQAISSQRSQELQAIRSSSHVMLLVAGLFAALAFAAMLLMAVFQWRTINRLAEISAALPFAHNFMPASPLAALGTPDAQFLAAGPAGQSSQRLLGSLEQLEKRISQLEHTAHSPSPNGASPDQNANPAASPPDGEAAPASPEAARIAMLLGKGLSHLNLDQAEEALTCFDQILELDPGHSEALVRRGAALERLRRLDEAIACYDRAIAANSSLTIAYLYKGGLFNRMERFGEALECYEQALRTQETRRA